MSFKKKTLASFRDGHSSLSRVSFNKCYIHELTMFECLGSRFWKISGYLDYFTFGNICDESGVVHSLRIPPKLYAAQHEMKSLLFSGICFVNSDFLDGKFPGND